MLEVHKITVGDMLENTYVVVNEVKEALIFDPGDEAERIVDWIEANGWQPVAVLLTHCHYDHIGALDVVRTYFDIEAYVYPSEAQHIVDATLNLSGPLRPTRKPIVQSPAEHLWEHVGIQQVGSFEFRLIYMPGHSVGHVAYVFDAAGFVICGDTVFRRGIGRTDLPGGSYGQLMRSIADNIVNLPGDYRLYPGHGEATTIAEELAYNPYLECFK